ncbi:MAG: hypothetical protein ACP5TK_02570, partial [Candidatus Micrarchaeia archaeon]
VLGKEIGSIKTEEGWTVAAELFNSGGIGVKVKALLTLGMINSGEEQFTARLLANTINLYRYNQFFLEIFNTPKKLGRYQEKPNVPSICNLFVERTNLNRELKDKLAKLFAEGTEVENIVMARNLIYATNYAKSDLKYLVSIKSGKELRKSLPVLQTLVNLIKEKVINSDDKYAILRASDAEKALGSLLARKVGGYFGEKISDEALDAIIQKPNFVTDLFRFNSLYAKYAHNAHAVLLNAMRAYFQSGIKGFKDFKFYGHELADIQLGETGADLIHLKEKLIGIDKLSAVALPQSANKTDAVKTEILNYKAHREELFYEAKKIQEEVSNALESVTKEASANLGALIENRDLAGMRAKNFGEEEMLKRKTIALILTENAVKSISKVDKQIERAEGNIDNYDDLREIIREGEKSNKDMIESLSMFDKMIKKRNEAPNASLALDNMLAILRYDEKSTWASAIVASFTFDPSEILTFGRYGASGAGNCQNSNSQNANLNQSLMSMLADSNQLMIRFTRPDSNETLGFLQVHVIQSSVGRILLLENPYTNQPDKSETMRKAAEALAVNAAKYIGMGIKVYSSKGKEGSANDAEEYTNVIIPKSYVGRYIDAISQRIGSEAREVEIRVERMAEDVGKVSIRR